MARKQVDGVLIMKRIIAIIIISIAISISAFSVASEAKPMTNQQRAVYDKNIKYYEYDENVDLGKKQRYVPPTINPGGGGSGGVGNGDVVAAASEGSGLDCGECVSFVNSVYAKAGLPLPLNGNLSRCPQGNKGVVSGGSGGYYYCKGFSITNNPSPGDVVVWSDVRGNGFGHVGIYMGGLNVSEAPPCKFNRSPPYYGWDVAHTYLHYDGS